MICVACHKRGGDATDRCPFCGTPYEHASKEQFSPEFVANLDKECLYDFHVKNIDLDFDMDAVHRMMVSFGLEEDDHAVDHTVPTMPMDEPDEEALEQIADELIRAEGIGSTFAHVPLVKLPVDYFSFGVIRYHIVGGGFFNERSHRPCFRLAHGRPAHPGTAGQLPEPAGPPPGGPN